MTPPKLPTPGVGIFSTPAPLSRPAGAFDMTDTPDEAILTTRRYRGSVIADACSNVARWLSLSGAWGGHLLPSVLQRELVALKLILGTASPIADRRLIWTQLTTRQLDTIDHYEAYSLRPPSAAEALSEITFKFMGCGSDMVKLTRPVTYHGETIHVFDIPVEGRPAAWDILITMDASQAIALSSYIAQFDKLADDMERKFPMIMKLMSGTATYEELTVVQGMEHPLFAHLEHHALYASNGALYGTVYHRCRGIASALREAIWMS